MSLSSLKRFLPAAPPRQVVLLPDTLFFVRSVPVTEGATAEEVAAQAELAIESLAPFPIAQLYYGHHWLPGAKHALIYSAYRKRFTAEEVETWADAEAVLPSFVTALSKDAPHEPATVVIVPGPTGLTGIYFSDKSGVPTQVVVQALAPDATDAERTAACDALLRAFPEKLHVLDTGGEPQFDPESPPGEFVIRTGALTVRFDADDIAPLDVRDKAELAARRRAHARDVILWRVFVGSLVAIGLAALLELGLIGATLWQKQRLALVEQQSPVVATIETSQNLATRIDELSTKRLLPMEMLALVNTVRPPAIQFRQTATRGLHVMEINAETNSSADIDAYRSALNNLDGCEKAEVSGSQSRDGVSTFRLVVTFKPDAFVASEEPPAAEPPVAEPETEEDES